MVGRADRARKKEELVLGNHLQFRVDSEFSSQNPYVRGLELRVRIMAGSSTPKRKRSEASLKQSTKGRKKGGNGLLTTPSQTSVDKARALLKAQLSKQGKGKKEKLRHDVKSGTVKSSHKKVR
jgi:hypothetical protein